MEAQQLEDKGADEEGKVNNSSEPTERRPAKRKKNNSEGDTDINSGDDNNKNNSTNNSGLHWQPFTAKFLACISKLVKSHVGFKHTGRREFYGCWPSIHYGPYIQPSSDPKNFLRVIRESRMIAKAAAEARTIRAAGAAVDKNHEAMVEVHQEQGDAAHSEEVEAESQGNDDLVVEKEHYALPDMMVWAPELRWPELYPEGKPQCIWHPGSTSCVRFKGMSSHARRCYGECSNVALYGYRYTCRIRHRQKLQPFSFQSYDARALALGPPQVQAYWREHGFCLTSHAGVSWKLVDRGRDFLANGARGRVSAFYRSVIVSYKQTHKRSADIWNASNVGTASASPYFAFDDPKADIRLPSLVYLTKVIQEAEPHAPAVNAPVQNNGINIDDDDDDDENDNNNDSNVGVMHDTESNGAPDGIEPPRNPGSDNEAGAVALNDYTDEDNSHNTTSGDVVDNDSNGHGEAGPTEAVARSKRRCRRCGKQYAQQPWRDHHVGQRFGDNQPHQVCQVPRECFSPGFPLKQGQQMPRLPTKYKATMASEKFQPRASSSFDAAFDNMATIFMNIYRPLVAANMPQSRAETVGHAAAAKRGSSNTRQARGMRRCRRCGKEFSHSDWRSYHAGRGFGDKQPHQVCQVPWQLIDPGFPLVIGQRMPRKRKQLASS